MLNFARQHRHLSAFLAGTLLYLLACLPALIYRGGFFYYFGDYIFQTIEFYTSAHEAVAQGYLFWNPNIELGGSMAGCYGFYLWGSPFFWISMLLPTSAIPYALPFIMSLRYGTAACTGFLWIRQFTRSDRAAFIGALLYAFSGFQAVNIVFSHFHDITAFFPLFLYAFDRFMQGESPTPFALATAFMACVNYYFFFGEVVFLVIYWAIRWRHRRAAHIRSMPKEQRKTDAAIVALERRRHLLNLRQFGTALGYGTLGVLLAAAFLAQTVLGILGNSRLGDTISGNGLLAYSEPTTFWTIVKSVFFVPELMGRQSLFNNSQIQWSSVSLYLPCLSIAGVIAYVRSKRRRMDPDQSVWLDWQVRLIVLLGVMTVIPGLSALFSALNSTFYARWYYLPVLVMAAMSAQALETSSPGDMRAGAKFVIGFTVFFIVFSFLPGQSEEVIPGILSVPDNFKYYVLILVATIAGLVFLGIAAFHRSFASDGAFSSWTMMGVVAFCCVLSTACVLLDGCLVYSNADAQAFEEQCLRHVPEVDQSSYSRVETDDTAQNWALIWGLPVNRTFLSTPAPAIFDIYDKLADGRTQESNIEMSHMGLRTLMSTRYYLRNQGEKDDSVDSTLLGIVGALGIYVNPSASFDDDSDDENSAIPSGFTQTGTSDGFAVYEADHFLPMGFTFDTFMRESVYEEIRSTSGLSGMAADRLLLKNLVLSDEMADKYADLLEEDSTIPEGAMTSTEFYALCDMRAEHTCSDFSADPGGYSAAITLDRDNLVFFSIPYDKGFSATVDGQPQDVECVDYGFIALRVPAGEHEIRLDWRPWGLEAGIAISAATAVALAALAMLRRRALRDHAEHG